MTELYKIGQLLLEYFNNYASDYSQIGNVSFHSLSPPNSELHSGQRQS